MRWVWLALCAAGCGRFGFASERSADALVDASTPAVTDGRRPAGVVLFSDDFSAPELKPEWTLWRMQWVLMNGKLQSLPAARTGFDYGHTANGRGGEAIVGLVPADSTDPLEANTFVGDPTWTDYRVEADLNVIGIDSSFDPYGLALDCRGIAVDVRTAEASESWNQPATTTYGFSVWTNASSSCGPFGMWSFGSTQNSWISDGAGGSGLGYCGIGSNTCMGSGYTIDSGTTTAAIDGENHIQVDVHGNEFSVVLNGTSLFDTTDTAAYVGSDAPIAFGGVGFAAAWEGVMTIDNVVITQL